MRKIIVLTILLALCIPAMAQTGNKTAMPDMVGKWTGIMSFVGWEKNTAWMPNETASYWPDVECTITINEQNAKMFSGEIVPTLSPRSKEVVLGILSSDNKTFNMVDEIGYWWGEMISPTEMELYYQEVDILGMEVGSGIFKKA